MGGLLSIAFLRGWCEGCGNGVPTLQSKTLRERKSSRILLFYQQPPKWQEETERKRQEYLYKRQSFINDNLEKMKMLEKRPAPQLDDVTILIPADKPRFSKKK